jgi:hypothetical protein
MRMPFIPLLITAIMACASAFASPVTVDFSRSHTIDDLEQSGLELKRIAGGLKGQAYAFQNQDIRILLPGGRSISQLVVLGTADTENDQLTRISMTGEVMPHDQAFEVARTFHQAFGLKTGELEDWHKRNIGKVRDAEPYSVSANLNFYPRIGISIRQSMNALYPWVIGVSISWDWDKQRDWDEERVWRELPPLSVAAISLNPPSGEAYDRRDAYKELLEEQRIFEQELAATGQAPNPAMVPSASDPTTTPKPSPAVQVEPSKSFPWPWVIGAILLLVVVGGILFKFLRK